MNKLNDLWTVKDYKSILEFVEKHLWLYVRESSTTYPPMGVISAITQLNVRDIHYLQKIYFLFSKTVQDAIRIYTPYLLRHLNRSSTLANSDSRGLVRGKIEWNLTLKKRAQSGSDPLLYVTQTPTYFFPLIEIQA